MKDWNEAIQEMVGHPIGHNGGPPLEEPKPDPAVAAMTKIDDLYDEAKNFADGEPINSQEMHDEIERLFDSIADAGKEAEALRVAEKKPHDEAAKAVQEKWNPYVQDKKGRVALARSSLSTLLAAWRTKVAKEKARKAKAAADEAAKLAAEAQAAMRASAGNLAAREIAEEQVELAKDATRFAKRTEKAATTGLGLRTSYKAVMVDPAEALTWAWGWDGAAFEALALELAQTAARAGTLAIPGFRIDEVKTAI